MKSSSYRSVSVLIVYDVIYKKNNLANSIQNHIRILNSAEQIPAIRSLCFEAIRNYLMLEADWKRFTPKTPKDKMVRAILTLALTEFRILNKPSHVVVNEAINTAKRLKKKWACGLINSCLRKSVETPELKPTEETATYSHPQWWIDLLKKDWPKNWEEILIENNKKPPLWIRANSHYKGTLKSQKHEIIESAHKIEPCDITSISEFNAGEISVQDASAQLSAYILEPQNSEKILDACAAPGGKSCHLLEMTQDIHLDSLELYSNRARKIHQNLQRLNLESNVIIANASHPEEWFNGEKYDKILLDAPCSASGIVRRQPDIKYLRTENELQSICLTQKNLLNEVSNLLKPGGVLLYATCSVFACENSQQIKKFLKTHSEFSEIKLNYPFAVNCEFGIQILPGSSDMDGFYYCCLNKNA